MPEAAAANVVAFVVRAMMVAAVTVLIESKLMALNEYLNVGSVSGMQSVKCIVRSNFYLNSPSKPEKKCPQEEQGRVVSRCKEVLCVWTVKSSYPGSQHNGTHQSGESSLGVNYPRSSKINRTYSKDGITVACI